MPLGNVKDLISVSIETIRKGQEGRGFDYQVIRNLNTGKYLSEEEKFNSPNGYDEKTKLFSTLDEAETYAHDHSLLVIPTPPTR